MRFLDEPDLAIRFFIGIERTLPLVAGFFVIKPSVHDSPLRQLDYSPTFKGRPDELKRGDDEVFNSKAPAITDSIVNDTIPQDTTIIVLDVDSID